MAKKAPAFLGIHPDTEIEVVRVHTKTGKAKKKNMKLSEWSVLKKEAGYTYQCFQKGFSQFSID